MDKKLARLILQAYRPGLEEEDPDVAQALQMAEQDPEMGHWFAEEQAFDRAIATHLDAMPAPFGLKTRILAQGNAKPVPQPWSWVVKLAGVAALLFLLVQVANLVRAPSQPSVRMADFASEMVSFIRISPRLEMSGDNLGTIEKWLSQKNMPPMDVPRNVAALEPVGCRILSFRAQKVTLICFQRADDGLAHLFVVNRSAMPEMKPGGKPVFAQEGEWATASWVDKDSVYMVTVKGGTETVKKFLPSA
ncbi:MAG: hypothetical protein ACR2G0_01085 [Chthoniobacterales bacterium]